MFGTRRGEIGDLAEIAAIQAECPETAQWDVAEYPNYDFRVALRGDRVAGFLVARSLAADEHELLNLAVARQFRRQGVARELLRALLTNSTGNVFLEVRESNSAAVALYQSLGFQQVSRRAEYYENPPEAAIVMKFHSC